MKSGKCPKCGSSDIYRSHKPGNEGRIGNWLFIKGEFFRNKGAHLIHYACGQCNTIESYVADDESMQNIREEWIPMNPRKSKRKNDE
ncbi:MAG: hypothetical protein Q9P44_09205 [Anaerolineae bacterium]|nr:hypothetical protein [Anaerolineae bacterium]